MLKLLFQIFQMLFGGNKVSIQPAPQPSKSQPPTPVAEPAGIYWSNPDTMISKYFSVYEATYLPSWNIWHTPSEEEKANILKVAAKMDCIREFLDEPINVHVWIRPGAVNCPGSEWHGKDYNAFIKGAPRSSHKTGEAVDWSVAGKRTAEGCAEVRAKLLPRLEEWGIRMEDIVGTWVHIDIGAVVSNRFFKP
jgi:Peptidase M15